MNILFMGIVMAAMMLLAHGRSHHAVTPPPQQPEVQDLRHEASSGGCGHQHLSQASGTGPLHHAESLETEKPSTSPEE